MKRSGVLYRDIAEQIKHDIFSHKYPVGSMLPTENELEQLFGVSKITVRKAIEILAQEELVEKKSGKGTTVLSDRPYNKLSKTASFSQILAHSHRKIEKRVLEFGVAETRPGSVERAAFGPVAVRYVRLYILDGKPYILFTHHLPSSLGDVDSEELAQDSLYRVLNQHGFEIARFEDDFSAVELDEKGREALQTDARIAIKRVRSSRDRDGRIVEYSEAIYNTDYHPYQIEYEV